MGEQLLSTGVNSAAFDMFASLRCIFSIRKRDKIYSLDERPPFPIINDKPLFTEVLANLQLSDLVLFGTVYSFGLLFGYY